MDKLISTFTDEKTLVTYVDKASNIPVLSLIDLITDYVIGLIHVDDIILFNKGVVIFVKYTKSYYIDIMTGNKGEIYTGETFKRLAEYVDIRDYATFSVIKNKGECWIYSVLNCKKGRKKIIAKNTTGITKVLDFGKAQIRIVDKYIYILANGVLNVYTQDITLAMVQKYSGTMSGQTDRGIIINRHGYHNEVWYSERTILSNLIHNGMALEVIKSGDHTIVTMLDNTLVNAIPTDLEFKVKQGRLFEKKDGRIMFYSENLVPTDLVECMDFDGNYYATIDSGTLKIFTK